MNERHRAIGFQNDEAARRVQAAGQNYGVHFFLADGVYHTN
jgi:hypothetical protein